MRVWNPLEATSSPAARWSRNVVQLRKNKSEWPLTISITPIPLLGLQIFLDLPNQVAALVLLYTAR